MKGKLMIVIHQTRDGLPAIATTVRYTLPSRQQLKMKLQHLTG
jgi:hypothetical protein